MKKFEKIAIILLAFSIGMMSMMLIDRSLQKRRLVSTYATWQKLNLVLSQVDANYVDTIDRKAVTDAAITAALQKLDPHSVYMLPEPLKAAEEDLAGGFEGIGIQFNVPNDTAVVLSAIPGGPAEKAGVITGDRILKVGDRVIAGNKTPQDSMVRLMKGPKGTKVTIVMGRGGEEIPFEITRDKIPEHCVDAAFMLNDTTGYVRLGKFTRTTFVECHQAFDRLKALGMTKLVFDVRSNSGGYFDQACNLANEFLGEGQSIVYMEGLHRKREDVNANGKGPFQDMHIAVLIDENSASASEIFAGAIQDNDRGVIVGRRSFGKGLVQEPVYFTDGSGIRLTVARFYTPSGRCIQKPYSDDYAYDFYNRYAHGELTSADSIKVDSTKVFQTRGGRVVYGGGGIIPDVFVPMDTTAATQFHIQCNKKALVVRYSTRFMDTHKAELLKMSDFASVKRYLDGCDIDSEFLAYAASHGVKAGKGEWEQSRDFLLPQIKGLCARYSKVGEEAYYRFILPMDDVVKVAVDASSNVL